MKCDFCSSPKVTWRYPARDFMAPNLMASESVGEWLACDTCHDLIERGERGALCERSMAIVQPVIADPEMIAEVIMPVLREFHDRFYKNRTGPAEPYHS